jgi:hypothetical protein
MNEELLDDELIDEGEFQPQDNKAQRWLNIFLFLQILAAIIATGLAWVDIATIIGTGPGGSAVGVVVFVMAFRLEDKRSVCIGLSAPLLTLGCFLLIVILDWGPSPAQLPISIILAIYALLLLIVLMTKQSLQPNRIK